MVDWVRLGKLISWLQGVFLCVFQVPSFGICDLSVAHDQTDRWEASRDPVFTSLPTFPGALHTVDTGLVETGTSAQAPSLGPGFGPSPLATHLPSCQQGRGSSQGLCKVSEPSFPSVGPAFPESSHLSSETISFSLVSSVSHQGTKLNPGGARGSF